MRRHLNLRQIEGFKAVIESGTVSRAAELLNISQPSLSKLVANLEYDTKLKLFDRVKGRLAPTSHAMQLYEHVERIFADIRQIENVVDVIHREEQSRLTIGVLNALAGSFIQRAIKEFLRKSPNVFCLVESTISPSIVDRIITRKLDVGLVYPSIDNPYVTCEPILTHPLVCIMPPGHPLEAKSVVEPDDLGDVPFVSFPENDIGLLVDRMFERYRVKCNKVLVANAAPTICEMVAAGLGVSLVHPLVIGGLENRLVVRPFQPEMPYHFLLCRAPDSRNAQLIDAFSAEVMTVAAAILKSIG